jgi:hypothetical protein
MADAALVTNKFGKEIVDRQGNALVGDFESFRNGLVGPREIGGVPNPGWNRTRAASFFRMSPVDRIAFAQANPHFGGVNVAVLEPTENERRIAATKIQANFRGLKVRQNLKAQKEIEKKKSALFKKYRALVDQLKGQYEGERRDEIRRKIEEVLLEFVELDEKVEQAREKYGHRGAAEE